MKLTQFSPGIAAVVAVLAATAVAVADEPRGYETYDDLGLIYFEDIKPVPKEVTAAWAQFKSGNYQVAYRQFEKLVYTDKLNDEAITGLVESAKKLGWVKSMIAEAEKKLHIGTNKDLYALNLMKALAKWSKDVERNGNIDVFHYLEYAQTADKKGFLPKLRSALVATGKPKEQRKTWDRLCAQYPKSEGMQFYRCKVYINGDLGGGYIDPDTNKIISTTDKEDLPKPEIALKIVKPFLARSDIPKWAAYVACFAYKNMRQKEKVRPYRKIIEAAAKTGNPVYVRWNDNVQKLLKLRN